MIKQKGRTRRRQAEQPAGVQLMTAWKRVFAAAFFIVGGGGAAVWGIYDIVAWVGAMHQGEGMIETESFILGLPLLGAGLCAIGPEFIVPRVAAAWSNHLKTRVAAIVLGSFLAGILLVVLGQPIISATMELAGYRACHVGGRGRVTVVTWIGADVACGTSAAINPT